MGVIPSRASGRSPVPPMGRGIFLMPIALLLGLLAASPMSAAVPRPVSSVSALEPSATSRAPRADTVRIADDLGGEIVLTAPAGRIVSLVPAITELLFAMGAGDRLVGRTRFDEHPPEARRVPSVGDGVRPSAELVVAREPDLVVLYAGAENWVALRELGRAGLRVLAVRHDRLEDLERNLERLGRATACEREARRLRSAIREGLRRVAAATESLPRRTVYYEVWGDPPITVGAGSFLDTLISVAGGRNAFGDLPSPSPQVSLEAIARRRPELVLWAGPGDASLPPPADRPGWSAVEAVRTGAVRTVDVELLHRLGPRVPEAAAALARAIHPEAELPEPTFRGLTAPPAVPPGGGPGSADPASRPGGRRACTG